MSAKMVDDVMSLVSEADAVLLEYLKGKTGADYYGHNRAKTALVIFRHHNSPLVL